jgi:hypothetical protein
MSRYLRFLAIALAAFAVVAAGSGCERKEEQPAPRESAPQVAPGHENLERATARVVVVPAEGQGKWKAVQVAVLDKEANQEKIYTVDIGSSFTVENSDLSLEVKNFLPAFTMDGATISSASSELKNPAAQIVIRGGGEEIFKGWLFSLYPETHAFQHPRYSFTLVAPVPAE